MLSGLHTSTAMAISLLWHLVNKIQNTGRNKVRLLKGKISVGSNSVNRIGYISIKKNAA